MSISEYFLIYYIYSFIGNISVGGMCQNRKQLNVWVYIELASHINSFSAEVFLLKYYQLTSWEGLPLNIKIYNNTVYPRSEASSRRSEDSSRSSLIWMLTVCKGCANSFSALKGLKLLTIEYNQLKCFQKVQVCPHKHAYLNPSYLKLCMLFL